MLPNSLSVRIECAGERVLNWKALLYHAKDENQAKKVLSLGSLFHITYLPSYSPVAGV